MSSSLSYLTTLYAGSFGGGSSLLDTIYGIGTSSAGSTDPVQALQLAERNQTQDVKVTAAQPMVNAAITAFTQAVKSAKSMTQLLANPAFMNVLLTANGMKDQIGYTALATQALTSKVSDPKSLVNQLTDTRWKTLAQNYNFSSTGLASLQNPATIASIAKLYATDVWETNQDQVTPGLSNALAFMQQASSIKTADDILGDPANRAVVTTALGIPQEIAFQSLGAQENAIAAHLDIKKLQDPKFVVTLTDQYLLNMQQQSQPAADSDLNTLAAQARGIVI
jgi:hypothetical protein